ncbi:MAG: hypothetical protein EPN22_01295 [Nitrospirae bacterium]|nr:MAG: hypothetical protein EPN22_01295 [Nitrospirota bacterium]
MEKNKEKKQMLFYPDFLFREAVAAVIVVAAILAVTLIWPMKVGDPADPSDTSFKPRPEWYFMAPFYLLKIVPSSLEIIPTVILPPLLFAALIALPFVDRDTERSPKKRPLAMALMAAMVLLTAAFTLLGILS